MLKTHQTRWESLRRRNPSSRGDSRSGKKSGQSRESDEDEPEEEVEQGVILLHKLFARKVTLHPGNMVQKSGKRILLEEAEALRVAEEANVPVPHVYKTETTPDGKNHIWMDYVSGQTLKEAWPDMSANQKKDICRQLRDILTTMRSIPPPPDFIGACGVGEIRDTRSYFTHKAPACRDEQTFNDYLLAGLFNAAPQDLFDAFHHRLRVDHRIVLAHSDFCPRNIIVEDGKVKAVIDWEDAGWYPEYWEYVKFFQRSSTSDGDWWHHARDIFPQTYPDEFVDYQALARWQSP